MNGWNLKKNNQQTDINIEQPILTEPYDLWITVVKKSNFKIQCLNQTNKPQFMNFTDNIYFWWLYIVFLTILRSF